MKKIKTVLLIFILELISINETNAQCAMCKSTIESNATLEVTNRAQGLNTGILYLMILPYILFGILGYLWYKNSKKEKAEREKIDAILRRSIEN